MVDLQPKLTLANINKADLGQGRHVLIVESPESRRAVSLNVNVFSIGRHPHNDLIISDSLASRHHATVAWMKYADGDKSDYSYWIIDGKGKRKRSRNGVFVNGVKKSLHRLTSGDIVSLNNNIKISYSYIPYNTDNSQFLNQCDREADGGYQPIVCQDKSYRETMVGDMGASKETIIKE